MSEPYNPLDKLNLAKSIEAELLTRKTKPLAAAGDIAGAGVYAVYYDGPFAPYLPTRASRRDDTNARPIYVGKAVPKGARKGGLTTQPGRSRALADRLGQHASSIDECENLSLSDFYVRHLVVDDIWIPLGENVLIQRFSPVWNQAVDGFGNKDPGRRRATQFKSPWDVLHPGRLFSEKLADSPLTPKFLIQRIDDYFAGRKLARLPKVIVEQQILAGALEEAPAED